jgi:hypothetical protein
MSNAQQRIDGYLGPGWYKEWQEMDKQETEEEERYEISLRRLGLPITSPLFDRIYGDLTILAKIAKDYEEGMKVLAGGRRLASLEQLKRVHDLYTLALGVADNENDVLDALWVTGFAAAWVVFPFGILQAKSKLMLDALAELKKALKEAEHEVSKGRTKAAFHVVVTFFEAMFPEISLTARAAIFLSDVIVDKALGPPHPATAQKYTGIVTPGVKQFSEAVHHIETYSSTARSVAEKTGKVATVATFYFDYKEIAEGTELVDRLKERTEKLKKAHDELVKVIQDNKPKIRQFLRTYERWMLSIESTRVTAANVRKALAKDITRYGYSPPIVWRAVN